MNTKAKGERSEGIILGHLTRLGYVVLFPFGNNQRYDLVVDRDGGFIRGQCKTATYQDGSVVFYACSTNGFTGQKRGYRGQIDVFWVYCPALDQVYEVPVNDVGERVAYLRVDPLKFMKGTRTKWASKYRI